MTGPRGPAAFCFPRKRRLSAGEEVELGRRIRAGDIQARNTLVEHNYALVYSAARHFKPSAGMEYEDMIQEGMLGLVVSAEKFDPDKGCRFSTVAHWWIRQHIARSIERHATIIKQTHGQHAFLRRVDQRRWELTMLLGRMPTDEEIAENMEVSERTWYQMQPPEMVSLSYLMGEQKDTPLAEMVPGPDNVEAEVLRKLALERVMQLCSPEEWEWLYRRIGEGRSLQEVGDDLGISREGSRQRQHRLLTRIRTQLQREEETDD